MPNREKWHVSDDMIARAWAANLARRMAREGNADPQAIFEQEYDRTLLSDDSLLIERATDLNWLDVEAEAIQVSASPGEPLDQWAYEQAWFRGQKQVVL
jgi:hypothetical protein